jgi:hypothetical protein
MEQPAPKKKINLGTIVGLVIGLGITTFVQQYYFKAPSFDKVMMQAASEINKSCPLMVDQDTQLDNSIAMPENTFQYNYTLINTEKSMVDVEQLKNYITPNLINIVKTHPDLKNFRENKVTIAYSYSDKNKEFLFKVSISPDLYEN